MRICNIISYKTWNQNRKTEVAGYGTPPTESSRSWWEEVGFQGGGAFFPLSSMGLAYLPTFGCF